jgi:hypothetical protein
MHISRRGLSMGLMVAAAALVFVSIVAAVGYWYVSRDEGGFSLPGGDTSASPELSLTEPLNPSDHVQEEAILPSSAILSLAQVDLLESVTLAMSMEHWESAYAAIVFSSELPADQRGGSLLLLADAFAKEGNSTKAGVCYWQAATIATLSPDLSDLARADTFIRVGKGLRELGWSEEGERYLDQAHTVAMYGSDLPRPVRGQLLGRIAELYQEWEQDGPAQRCFDEMSEVHGILRPLPPSATLAVPSPGMESEPVAEAESQRRAAAQALADHLLANPSGEDAEELLEALSEALLAEENVRRAAHAERLQQASRLLDRARIMELWIAWLDIRHRVAARAYGLSIVPEWEADLANIRAEINQAYQETFALYGDQVMALPAPEEIEPAWVAVLRHEILVGRLGLYPSYPEAQLVEELDEHIRNLPDPPQETSWLWVEAETVGGTTTLSLIPAVDYGKAEGGSE